MNTDTVRGASPLDSQASGPTPLEMRIAIAEVNGFKPPFHDHHPACHPDMLFDDDVKLVPDYLNDLNAMIGPQSRLSELERPEYVFMVGMICGGFPPLPDAIIFATAAQKAEAFLRVKRPDLFK